MHKEIEVREQASVLFNNSAERSSRALQVGSFDRFGNVACLWNREEEWLQGLGCCGVRGLPHPDALQPPGVCPLPEKGGGWQRAGACRLQPASFLSCHGPAAAVPPAARSLVLQWDLLMIHVLSLHKSGVGEEVGTESKVWDENEIPTASAGLHPL